MPDVERRTSVPLPLDQVWPYVADMNNWAADVPGYRSHEMLSERESVWRLAGDVGILTREVDLRVTITDWQAPSLVRFTLVGEEEPVNGNGSFATESIGNAETGLMFVLEVSAGGPLAPVINVLLKTQLARIADQFIATLQKRLVTR